MLKIEDFVRASSLDLNMGYYLILLLPEKTALYYFNYVGEVQVPKKN